MLMLKQSTAVTVKIGPFVDDADGKTAETGLTISQADVRLSKNGGDIAQKNEASAATHDEIGVYDCSLSTTDTNTLGRLQLWVHESGALPVWHEFMVLPANVWDSLFGADKLQVDVEEIGAGMITAAAIATDAIDADALKADAVTEIQSGLSTLDAAGVRTAVGLASANLDTQMAAIAAYIDTEVAAILAAVDTEVAAIKAKTDNLPASPAAVGSEMALVDGAITAAKLATDAIAAAKVAADAVTKMQNGLATAAELAKVKGAVAGKCVVNAAGDEVQLYDAAGALLVTLARTGTGPYTWTPTWA